MKHHIIILLTAILLGATFYSCSDDDSMSPIPPYHPTTLWKPDSLVIVDLINTFCLDSTMSWDPKDISTWGGVKRELVEEDNEIRVTEIYIPNASQKKGLPIPASIGHLSRLRAFKMFIDDHHTPLLTPKLYLCPLKDLRIDLSNRYNYVRNTKVIDTIPPGISRLAPTLERLELTWLNIGGTIPEEITKLKCTIFLNGNVFSGKIPLYIRDCPGFVSLGANYFTEIDWRMYTERKFGKDDLSVDYNYLPADIPYFAQKWIEENKIKCVEAANGRLYPEFYEPQYGHPDVWPNP